MPPLPLKTKLDALYSKWHKPEFLGTDPLVLVREAAPEDREVAAFLVSCLAVGRASLVVQAGRDLLKRLGTPLASRLADPGRRGLNRALDGFVYRFFSGARVGALVTSVGRVLRTHGSLEAGWKSTGVSGWDAVLAFGALFQSPGADLGILVPAEDSSGAAKRINLFLRWMVRSDAIDVGTWTALAPPNLFMPIDTHVLQWARAEGLTNRNVADRKACWVITTALRSLCPEDPLRYDFAITRQGMFQKNTL